MESRRKAVSEFVAGKIGYMLKSQDESHVRASLAHLRRGIGREPGSMAETWELTLDGLPEECLSKTGAPTREEWAVYISLTLFALHQQGKDPSTEPMSVQGKPFGNAVRKLALNDGEADALFKGPVKRRFDTIVTSNSLEELTHHMRGMIQLLKSKKIPLDYPQLAEDIYDFQSEYKRDGVKLRWGQDYVINRKDEEDNDE